VTLLAAIAGGMLLFLLASLVAFLVLIQNLARRIRVDALLSDLGTIARRALPRQSTSAGGQQLSRRHCAASFGPVLFAGSMTPVPPSSEWAQSGWPRELALDIFVTSARQGTLLPADRDGDRRDRMSMAGRSTNGRDLMCLMDRRGTR
jgi:hypothetical protein